MTGPVVPRVIRSHANPQVKAWRQLVQTHDAYRRQSRIWVEGDHLCRAALARGWKPLQAVFAESFWLATPPDLRDAAADTVLVSDALMATISGLKSPAPMAFVLAWPEQPTIQPGVASVVLDRIQDAGNVGSILRSAAAFGFKQVLALAGTAALGSPKVLRAGMGAHFGLHLVEGLGAVDLSVLSVPLLSTSSHRGALLHEAALPWPCAWILGNEGQGVAAELMARTAQVVRIAQPGGEESLNVAAAAAICLHASAAAHGS
ncbi:MAG: RNA methyltransferase [Burkholderiaceae bacterium]|nr:MAG: RNA methyltransferase [Burkholderiaceae bacterium]